MKEALSKTTVGRNGERILGGTSYKPPMTNNLQIQPDAKKLFVNVKCGWHWTPRFDRNTGWNRRHGIKKRLHLRWDATLHIAL